MLFDRDEEIRAALLALIRGRPDGKSLVAAFRGLGGYVPVRS